MSRKHRLRMSAAVLLALVGICPAAWAQCNPQLNRLVGTGLVGSAGFGTAVAWSSDGGTLLVGAPGDSSGLGAVVVFANSTQQKITPVGSAGGGFGTSVALSADGNTAAVGCPSDNGLLGAVYVLIRSGSAWSQQARLVATDEFILGRLGTSIALSADGNTLAAGAPLENDSPGAVYVFVRTGTSWSQQQRLNPGGNFSKFGRGVALSAAGNRLMISAENNGPGSVHMATRTGTVWSTGLVAFGSGTCLNMSLSNAIAVSGDGNTAVCGDTFFTWSGSAWSPQRVIVAGSSSSFGLNSALAPDGQSAVIGPYLPAVCFFAKRSGLWIQTDPPSPFTGAIGTNLYATSVSCCPGMVAAGVPGDSSQGAVYIYGIAPPTTFTTQPLQAVVAGGGSTSFSASAQSLASVSYRWRRNGVNLSDGLTPGGSTVSGTTSPILTLSSAATGDTGAAFDCVASTTCGSITSYPAGLLVNVPYCLADMGIQGGTFGHDGLLDNNDFVVFINAFFSHTGCP